MKAMFDIGVIDSVYKSIFVGFYPFSSYLNIKWFYLYFNMLTYIVLYKQFGHAYTLQSIIYISFRFQIEVIELKSVYLWLLFKCYLLLIKFVFDRPNRFLSIKINVWQVHIHRKNKKIRNSLINFKSVNQISKVYSIHFKR